MQRKLRSVAGLVIAVAIMTGCSSGSGENAGDNVATTSSTAVNGTSNAAKPSNDRDKLVQFSECMRNNGLGDFPDPNAKGEFAFGIGDKAAFDKALKACKSLEPAGLYGDNSSPKEMSARLVFATCMRQNGVPDFPDPIKNEPLVDTSRIPSMANKTNVKDDAVFNGAMKRCKKPYDDARSGK